MRFDTAGDLPRARQLYDAVMAKFPDDDLALDAARRLTQLADMDKQKAAADAQAAAVKAAEERAKAAEAAARKAADEAARQRLAREEEARRADAARREAEAERQRQAEAERQRAAAQPRPLASCNRVYVGMEFKGGMFGIFRYRVQGMNPYTGSVTIREIQNGGTQEIHCSQVP